MHFMTCPSIAPALLLLLLLLMLLLPLLMLLLLLLPKEIRQISEDHFQIQIMTCP